MSPVELQQSTGEWVAYDWAIIQPPYCESPGEGVHEEGVLDNVTDGNLGTSFDAVLEHVCSGIRGPELRVWLEPADGGAQPVTQIRATLHVGTSPVDEADVSISYSSGSIVYGTRVWEDVTIYDGDVFLATVSSTVMMDEIVVKVDALRYHEIGAVNNPIGFAEVEVIGQPDEPPVDVAVSTHTLTLNDEGWSAPNPIAATVTATNTTGETIEDAAVLFTLNSTDELARFYVLEENGHGEGLYGGSDQYFEDYYGGEAPLVLSPGETISTTWRVWVQPSEAATLTVSAQLVDLLAGPLGEDAEEVSIPLAQIHPVVFVHGILGSMPPGETQCLARSRIDPFQGIYDPLLENLEHMGYDDGTTLYAMPYDWRRSNRYSADLLDETITAQLAAVANVPYVNQDGQVDLVVHSMGGLVSRAYVQGYGLDDENGDAPIPYDGDVRKVIFIASPHRGFPITYRTWEGLTWDDYLYENDQTLLRFFMNQVLWPNWIRKQFDPTPAEMQAAGCYPAGGGGPGCPSSAYYTWSHDPERGILSLAEMLPTEDVPEDYLCGSLDENGCVGPYPHGHEANPLMNDLNAGVQVLASALGPENIYVIYGTENDTDYWYSVNPPDTVLWAYGKPTYLSVQGDDAFEKNEGDDLIPVYSNNLQEVLPSIPEANVAPLVGPDARHKQIMYHPDTQYRWVPTFLIGQTVPFTTTYQKPAFLVDLRQWLVLTALCPVDLTITDLQGRRAGYDPATGEVLEEIPDAVYASPGVEGQFIVVPRALAGDYQVNATGFDDGEYTLLLHRVDEGGAWPLAVFTGTVTAGQTVSHTLSGFTPAIFADSFDRPDSSDLGPAWVEVAGEFDIVDGQLHATAGGQDHLLLTTQTFTDTQFILESRFRGVLVGWPQAFDQAYSLFGADESGQGGYRVVYAPLQGQVLLYRDDVLLDSASIVPQLGQWYQLKVVRDGDTGLIQVYLDEGQGYPGIPTLEAVDSTYPDLRRLGWAVLGSGYDLYVDWIVAQ